MAVIGKKRTNSTTYYVVTWWNGRAWQERSGTDKREAERLDARRKREVAAGTFMPSGAKPEPSKSSTLDEYAERWGTERTNVSASDDRRNLGRFRGLAWLASMALADIRPRHVIAALKELRGSVSEKSLKNAYGTLTTMCRDAVIAEVIPANPCVLPRNFFDGTAAKERAIYSRGEVAVLMSHHEIPSPVRVLNALCLLAGLREGEACGRRWRDLDQTVAPLMALAVGTQYADRALKTKKARVVPVHPELAAILQDWAIGDFAALMGRPPEPDDYIVPYLSPRSSAGLYTRSIYYKAFVAGCAAAGIEARSLHSTRHTMVTMARRGGADRQILSKVTHNAKGEIIDRYNHPEWEPLCAAVLAIGSIFSARPSPRRIGENPQDSDSANLLMGAPTDKESPALAAGEPCSIPGASTQKHRAESLPRQSSRISNPEEAERIGALLGAGDEGEQGFEIALRDGLGSVRPPAKTRPPVGYVARKRGAR
jgi:integrase